MSSSAGVVAHPASQIQQEDSLQAGGKRKRLPDFEAQQQEDTPAPQKRRKQYVVNIDRATGKTVPLRPPHKLSFLFGPPEPPSTVEQSNKKRKRQVHILKPAIVKRHTTKSRKPALTDFDELEDLSSDETQQPTKGPQISLQEAANKFDKDVLALPPGKGPQVKTKSSTEGASAVPQIEHAPPVLEASPANTGLPAGGTPLSTPNTAEPAVPVQSSSQPTLSLGQSKEADSAAVPSPTPASTPAFAFGVASGAGTTPPVSASTFSFGSASATAPSFAFGLNVNTEGPQAEPGAASPTGAAFVFGSSAGQKPSSSSPSTGSSWKANVKAETSPSGNTESKSQIPSLFKTEPNPFMKVEAPVATATPGLKRSPSNRALSSAGATQAPILQSPPAGASSAAFQFNASPSSGAANTVTPANASSFGSTGPASPSTAISFGNPQSSSGTFVFGTSGSTSSAPAATNKIVFGGGATASSQPGASPSSNKIVFGGASKAAPASGFGGGSVSGFGSPSGASAFGGGSQPGFGSGFGVSSPAVGAGSTSFGTPGAFGSSSAPSSTPAFGGPASGFGSSSTPAFGGSASGFGSSGSPAFGGSASGFGSSGAPAFGGSASGFGSSSGPASGGGFGPSSTPGFGASTGGFGAPTAGFGTPSTGVAFGGSSSGSVPAFGGSSNAGSESSFAFGGNSAPQFGGASTPGSSGGTNFAFGQPSATGSFGSSQPAFGPSVTFGAQSASAASPGTAPVQFGGGFGGMTMGNTSAQPARRRVHVRRK